MAEILTQSAQDELLSSEALAANDLAQRVERAEILVLGRYKEDRGGLSWYYDGGLDPTLDVKLWGYREESDGTIDITASDDTLVRRLRLVVAAVVDWTFDQEQTEHVTREMIGSKSVQYDDAPTIPTRLFRPLKEYDEREPFHGF